MKHFILLLLTTFTLSCCNNDDDNKPIAEIDKLPPLTNTGANKAGCLVNGVAFLPKGYSQNGTNLQVYYDGETFTFSITENVNNTIKSVLLSSYNTELHNNIGTIFQLKNYEFVNGSKFGTFSINSTPPPSPSFYSTTSQIIGELKITNHNFNQATISGTFWFDAVNSNGEKVEVREGRFDMQY